MTPDKVDRDRGPDGRPRNDRPRDALGRPLAYGSPDVPRLAEGIRRAPQETIDEAQALCDAGRPFHAHEVFEDAWKLSPPAERDLWKGLAQLAVGLTHLARGNPRGASTLLRRAGTALRRCEPGTFDLDLEGLIAWCDNVSPELRSGTDALGTRADHPAARPPVPAAPRFQLVRPSRRSSSAPDPQR
ncbi:MAG: DUF309 domain-containing protein [Nakamurella sp.]